MILVISNFVSRSIIISRNLTFAPALHVDLWVRYGVCDMMDRVRKVGNLRTTKTCGICLLGPHLDLVYDLLVSSCS